MSILPPDILDDPTEGFPNDFLDDTSEILIKLIEKTQKIWRKVFSFAAVCLLCGLVSCTTSNNKTGRQQDNAECQVVVGDSIAETELDDVETSCEGADEAAPYSLDEVRPLNSLRGFKRYERKREFLKMEAVIRMTLPVEHEDWMAQSLSEFLWKEALLEYPDETTPNVLSNSQLMDYYLNLQVGTEGPDINEDRRHQTYVDTDSLCIVPIWQAEDKSYTTYRIKTFFYHGGAHPLYKDFCLTFDNERHCVLSSKEIFKQDRMDDVVRRLKRKVGDRSAFCYQEIEDDDEFMASISPRWERYQKHFIPRPALIGKGVVFSYQRYEIDSFAAGELHFVLPYAEIRDLLQPNIVILLSL